MITSIQLLRGVAALAVVIYHLKAVQQRYFSEDIFPWYTSYGFLGVQLFFMISGFIMMHILDTHKTAVTPLNFLKARLIRIVPTYWLITLTIFTVAQIYPNLINSSYSVTPSLIKSLLFIPQTTNPWLNVGWSLEFEVFFYIIISILLFTSGGNILQFLLVAFFLALSFPIVWGSSPVIESFTDPIILWFIIGVSVHFFWKKNSGINIRDAVFILPISTLILIYANRGTDLNLLILHLTLVCVFFGSLLTENIIPKNTRKYLDYIGKISYSLYLTHVLSLNIALIVLTKFMDLRDPIITNIVSIIFIILSAIIFYELVEKKIQTFIKNRL